MANNKGWTVTATTIRGKRVTHSVTSRDAGRRLRSVLLRQDIIREVANPIKAD